MIGKNSVSYLETPVVQLLHSPRVARRRRERLATSHPLAWPPTNQHHSRPGRPPDVGKIDITRIHDQRWRCTRNTKRLFITRDISFSIGRHSPESKPSSHSEPLKSSVTTILSHSRLLAEQVRTSARCGRRFLEVTPVEVLMLVSEMTLVAWCANAHRAPRANSNARCFKAPSDMTGVVAARGTNTSRVQTRSLSPFVFHSAAVIQRTH